MARFYTAQGKFVGTGRLPNAARSLRQVFLRRCFGIYPELPWIPFTAISELERVVTAQSTVWEIGAGMSTLWLAQRVRAITSIEADEGWYRRLSTILAARALVNVDLRFEWLATRMISFDGIPDGSLDLLFIDGGPRTECLLRGFDKVKSGGHLYLDNWDIDEFWLSARPFLDSRADEIDCRRRFVDYVPASFFVTEGLLIKKR